MRWCVACRLPGDVDPHLPRLDLAATGPSHATPVATPVIASRTASLVVHDVPDPVGVLASMRKLAHPDGVVLVADERTEKAFTVPTNEMERFF